jgi:lysophospholipase L1-like esterase
MRRALALLLLGGLSCGPVHVSPYAPEVYRVGRFDDQDPVGPRFSGSATRLSLRFVGPSVKVKLEQLTSPASAEGPPQTVRYRYLLDGQSGDLWGEQTFEAGPGEHRLTVVRESEALAGESQFKGFELPRGGRVLAFDRKGKRRIEFIGDSITVGFGNEGTLPCPYSTQTQAVTRAFPWRVGEAFEADVIVLGWSGHGVTRAWGDRPEPTVPEQWAPLPQAPDAVVVALGANDFWNGDPGEAFATAYAAFVDRIRAAYPKAEVYAVVTPLSSPERLSAMRRYLARAKARYLELSPVRPEDGAGCVWHPSAKTHRRMADEIIARLAADLGWRPIAGDR